MYVCVCVIVVTMRGWADVGLWVAVCFLAKISLQRPTCKTTFARLTQSQAIWHSFRVFIAVGSTREMTFFHFSKLLFGQNYRFFYHGDRKISWLKFCRWQAVNFEIHLFSSDMKSACIWRSISIQHVQIEPSVNSDLQHGSFWVAVLPKQQVTKRRKKTA